MENTGIKVVDAGMSFIFGAYPARPIGNLRMPGSEIPQPAVLRSCMRFDLTDLRLFLHVQETGSITAGARRT